MGILKANGHFSGKTRLVAKFLQNGPGQGLNSLKDPYLTLLVGFLALSFYGTHSLLLREPIQQTPLVLPRQETGRESQY